MAGNGGRLRQHQAIHGYVGPNGGGKTLAMVYDTLPSLAAGRRVLSTVRLVDPATGEDHPSYVPLTSWRQLADPSLRSADVLLDEVTGVASSRSFASLPPQLLNLFVQLRRRDIVLRWTSPNFARADAVLREVTRAVTVSKGYMPKRDPESRWPQNRFFVWITYDSIEFSDFELAKRDSLKPLLRQMTFRGKNMPAALHYDTLDSVTMLDHVDLSGHCLNCGGKRSMPKCSCPAENARLLARTTLPPVNGSDVMQAALDAAAAARHLTTVDL